MTGYYRSISDGSSIYHVYYKGFDLLARCVKSNTRTTNNPFKIDESYLDMLINRKCWERITDPEEINQLKTNQ